MEFAFWNELRAFLLQNSKIRRGKDMKILTLVLLFIANSFDSLLNHLLCSQKNREIILDVHQDDESVANLDVILRAQAGDDGAGDFEVPLVADMTEVLKSYVIIRVGALITDSKFSYKTWELCTFFVERRLI